MDSEIWATRAKPEVVGAPKVPRQSNAPPRVTPPLPVTDQSPLKNKGPAHQPYHCRKEQQEIDNNPAVNYQAMAEDTVVEAIMAEEEGRRREDPRRQQQRQQ